MTNLAQYFESEHQIYLKKIHFEKLELISEVETEEITLNCTDNITATLKENEGIELVLTRRLSFIPEQIFGLEVSFGVELKFNKEKAKEIDWGEINLADEFKNNGNFVLDNVLSRISLLIAQITASFNQSPLIIPPKIPKAQK